MRISFGKISGAYVLGCSGALLLVAAVAAQNRGPAELALAPVAPGAIRIPYGRDPLQFGELRVPAAKGPHPVAIVVHGGCWVSALGKLDPRAVAIGLAG